jgi:predicted tellurium resistance membrane protein TerC
MNPAPSIGEPWMWAAFIGFVLVMLALDLFVFGGKKAHKVGVKEAAVWSLVWVSLALLFNAGLWWHLNGSVGPEIADQKALEFLTGYLIEKSLSVDNVFVFLLIFASFHVVMQNGVRYFTPLFLVLILIETSDVVFAVDSIPAIFAITTDPFIVFTSNIFAIMGLRALYFLLVDVADRFHLLKYGLAMVLTFIGAKMLIAPWYHVPVAASLAIVAVLIGASIVASLIATRKKEV